MKKLTISTPEDSRHVIPKCGDTKPMKHKKEVPSFCCSYCSRRFKMLKQLDFHLSYCLVKKKKARNGVEKAPRLDGVSESYLQARRLAEASLEFLNEHDEGQQYELVEPGNYSVAGISGGPIFHLNLEAKARDCPGAEVETFFAQIRMHSGRVVDCCVALGPSRELTHWSKADNRGCKYCNGVIYHPTERCDKLLMGISSEEFNWLYGEKHDSEDSADYYDFSDIDDSDIDDSDSEESSSD